MAVFGDISACLNVLSTETVGVTPELFFSPSAQQLIKRKQCPTPLRDLITRELPRRDGSTPA